MNKTELILPGASDRPITLDISYVPGREKCPVVILVHGFKGFKDWGHFNLISRIVTEQGFVCLKFNMSHNGTTPEHLCDFDDLEAFGNNHHYLELRDMKRVLDFSQSHIAAYGGDPEQLFLIGHSRGGGIALLTAAQDQRVKKLCTWAAVQEFGKFVPEAELENWKRDGVYHTFNSRTKQQMPLYYQLHEQFLKHREQLDIRAHARQMTIPWLILHGTGDQTVPVEAAKELHALQPRSEIGLLENADHNFGGRHPWTSAVLPADADTALQATLRFFAATAPGA